MVRFINPTLDIDSIVRELDRIRSTHNADGINVWLLEGALTINDFLTQESRQLLEGQIYASGTDLRKVYRTSRTGFGANELHITEADVQVPLIGELGAELDEFLSCVFEGELKVHALQLRELAPNSFGHPRHVDYEKGFDIVEREGQRYGLTSVSLSLPISWNEGVAPAFVMETEQGEVVQQHPGSLAIFGPRVYHAHPPTKQLTQPYAWLVTQAFFQIPGRGGNGKPKRSGTRPSVLQANQGPNATASRDAGDEVSLSSWAKQIIGHSEVLKVLEASEDRIRRAYRELLSGYALDPASILNEVEEVSDYQGLVVQRDITFTSFCLHHFLPFQGHIDVVYEPNKIITGIGKLPRLVQAFSRRFQLQELLVRDIANQIMESLDAKGVFVRARATHLCVHSRGPSDTSTETVCCYGVGTLKKHIKDLGWLGLSSEALRR